MQVLFHLTQGLYLIHSEAVCNLHVACVSLKSAIFLQAVVTKLKGRVAKRSRSSVLRLDKAQCWRRQWGTAGEQEQAVRVSEVFEPRLSLGLGVCAIPGWVWNQAPAFVTPAFVENKPNGLT